MTTDLFQKRKTVHIVGFDCYEADLDAGQLRKRGVRIKLREQSCQVLAALLEHPVEVVTREELQRQLWPDDVFVDFENNLNALIAHLREVLSDSAEHPRFIETLPTRGYRFIAEVYTLPAAAAASESSRARLMVLPFVNLSGDPAQEYFSDAMTDEIITELESQAPEQLAVIARTTAMRYKSSHKDVARIGRELSVDYVVEGGVRRTEDRIGINVQLIQTSDQTHLFAKKYDAEMQGIFQMQRSIAQSIAAHVPAVRDRMRDGVMLPEHVRRKPTEDLAAYNEYVKGRAELSKLTPESLTKAKQHFESALARDSEFALACDGLVQLYWYLGFLGVASSREMDRIGRFYVMRAIEIDPTLAETHALLSFYPKQPQYEDRLCYYDWPASLKDVVHARELNPTSPLVQLRYTIVLMILGRTGEAAAEMKRALESDPLSLELRGWSAFILALDRQYDQVLEQARRMVELEPEHFLPYWILDLVLLEMKKFDDGAVAVRKAFELSGELPITLGWLGLSLGLGGHKAEVRAVLERLRALSSTRYVPPTSFAWTHLGLGDIDDAFLWMERALEAPDRMMSPIKSYPFLDPLRADPRFAELLCKINLEH